MIKVCGIKYEDNLKKILPLGIDMVGFNFYPHSKRYLKEVIPIHHIPPQILKVGVFVNQDIDIVKEKIELFNLDLVQLHGTESPEYCALLANEISVIKVFSIMEIKDFAGCNNYQDCKYFLFDTKTVQYGGSGNKFDWDLLQAYKGPVPFLLAGGIGPLDYKAINAIDHPYFWGVDINSKFEIEPGKKDIHLIGSFIHKLKKPLHNVRLNSV